MEIKKYKVSEIVESISVTHNFKTEKLYAVNTSDVLDGEFLTPELQPVNELKGQFKKTIKNKDILFSEIRPANRRFARVEFEDTSEYVVSTKLMVLRQKNKDVNLDYFYYWLTSNETLRSLQSRAENRIGSFPQITFDLLGEYNVPIPNELIQSKISQVLKSIDSKIKINNKINNELESMAKILYDYWFLQFEFPNEEGKPYKSSGGKMVWNEELKREIPEGWEVKNIIEIANLYQPKTISGNTITESGKYVVYGANGIIGKYSEYNHTENEIAICCRGASCGEYLMTLPKSWITGNSMVIKAKNDILKEYLYFGLSTQGLKRFVSGSAQPQITRNNLENMKVLLPIKKLINDFNKVSLNFRKEVQNLIYQNQELTSLRDFLLPLLMNGQVSFK